MTHWKTPLLLVFAAAASASSHRNLEDIEEFEWDDLNDFSVRFDKCQSVKMYDDELAEDQDATSVLSLQQFVLFSLCPSTHCGIEEDICTSNVHGEYAVDLETYLGAVLPYQQELFEEMCENCNDDGQTEGCGQLCYQYDNLEENGFVDASDYVECQKLEIQQEEEDEEENEEDEEEEKELYIGPKCGNSGSKIIIGLFTDENCWEPYEEETVQEVLGKTLSYHVFFSSSSSSGSSSCLACREEQDDGNDDADADQDADEVNEMCEALYEAAAKCESKYGIEGFVQQNRADGDYENQVENEFMSCTFINSLKWNSYTETGEINIVDEQDEVIRYTTPTQKASLTVLVLAAAGLGWYAHWLNKEIDTKYPSQDPLVTRPQEATAEHELT